MILLSVFIALVGLIFYIDFLVEFAHEIIEGREPRYIMRGVVGVALLLMATAMLR